MRRDGDTRWHERGRAQNDATETGFLRGGARVAEEVAERGVDGDYDLTLKIRSDHRCEDELRWTGTATFGDLSWSHLPA